MNDRSKRAFLLIGGIGLVLLGGNLVYDSQKNLPEDLSSDEAQKKLRSSNIPIGSGICGVGILFIIFVIVWKHIPTRYKP